MSALYVGFMVLVVLESAIADKGGSVVGDNAWHVLGVQAKRELLDNAPMKYVCQATAAAPTYLPPVDFILTDPNSTPPVSRVFNLIDGGVAVNNPVSIQIFIIKAFRFLFFSRTVQAIQPCMYRHTHDQFFCLICPQLVFSCVCVFLGVLGWWFSSLHVVIDLCCHYASNQGSAIRRCRCRKSGLSGFFNSYNSIESNCCVLWFCKRSCWSLLNWVITGLGWVLDVMCFMCWFFWCRIIQISWCCLLALDNSLQAMMQRKSPSGVQ